MDQMNLQRAVLLANSILLLLLFHQAHSLRDTTSLKGWKEVNKNWPMEEPEYFIATSKNHHFIEVKLPQPGKLSSNLVASIEYYFQYAKVKPVLQVVPCRSNIDIIPIDDDSNAGPIRGQWNRHDVIVRHEDCQVRNELGYNVILHDAGDVFAWRLVEVKSSIESPTTTTATTTRTTTTTTTTRRPTFDDYFGATTPKTTTTMSASPTERISTTEKVDQTTGVPTETESTATEEGEKAQTPLASLLDPSTSHMKPEDNPKPPASTSSGSSLLDSESADPSRHTAPASKTSTDREESTTFQSPIESPTNQQPDSPKSPRQTSDGDKIDSARFKRQVDITEIKDGGSSAGIEPTGASCRPKSCDRDQFVFARFNRVIKTLPQWPEGAFEAGKQFYLNLDDKPLELELKTEEDFAEVDTCLNLQLYMDPGTELELVLKDQQRDKPLELVERKYGDSTAFKWDTFKRCLSDYLPRLQSPDCGEIHKLNLQLIPKTNGADKHVAILTDPERAFSLAVQYPLYDYLPDVAILKDERQVENYWVLDKDGVRKPELIFKQAEDETENGHRVLTIRDIDQRQESFDLTSRWLKMNNLEILENPIFMMYRANRPDWIREIDFEFQRANSDWIRQRVYIKSAPEPTSSTLNSTQAASDATGSTELTITSSPIEGRDNIFLPIRMKGLDEKAFRLRIRHYLDKEAPSSSSSGNNELDISTLAFADACAGSSYCKNGGKCRPTGAATARCACRQGFSGRHCQHTRPCDVLYDIGNVTKQTGHQLCQYIGAECVPSLPVLRCKWPNDQYYQCEALYQEQANQGDDESLVVPAPPSGWLGPSSSDTSSVQTMSQQQILQLKEQTQRQAKLIIVLSVFMVALMLFAVVLMANVINRLMKSRRTLKGVQMEVVELTRRYQPGPSTAPALGRPASQRPANLSTYSNQAFDVE